MNANYSALTRAGNHFIDWKTSTDPPRSRGRRVRPLLWMAALFVVTASVTVAGQTETQHGTKLVGTGTEGPSEQGWSVALSADGSTAIVGGIVDKKLTGAAWIFTRNSDTWSQQGNKLVGTGVVGQAGQGVSVALSADGRTAMVGGPYDDSYTGAAWVFNRSGDSWSQQGNKLVGNGSDGKAAQGASVALSADGNTAIVGGAHDDSKVGAVWVGCPDARADASVHVAFRLRNSVGAQDMNLCEAQLLAYAFPYRRFAAALAGVRARLRVDADRYSLIVSDFHRLLLAGLPGALRKFLRHIEGLVTVGLSKAGCFVQQLNNALPRERRVGPRHSTSCYWQMGSHLPRSSNCSFQPPPYLTRYAALRIVLSVPNTGNPSRELSTSDCSLPLLFGHNWYCKPVVNRRRPPQPNL